MTHYNLVHKFIPMPQAMKTDAKAAVDKRMEKLETIPAWQLEKVKSKKEVILEAQRDKKKAHFATLLDICHLKNAEMEPKLQKYKGRVVLRGDIVKDDSGAKAKLDNARRLRGIYFVDPDDEDYKEILKKCEEKFGKTYGTSNAVQDDFSYQQHEGGCKAGNCIPKGFHNDLLLTSGIS